MNKRPDTRRIDAIGGFLVLATVLAWWLGEHTGGGAVVAGVLLALAAIKGGLVIWDFMALRHVKALWPGLLLGWLLLVLALIALAYRAGLS